MTLVLFAALVFFLAIGIPISFGIGLAGMSFLVIWKQVPIDFFLQQMFRGIDSFPLLAVPFFMLAGELMIQAGIMDILVRFVNQLVGRIRGGLAHVSIVANMFMAGISGSGTADCAALGSILIPAMERSGYDTDYSVAVITSASVMGPIIPPSITMILYGSIVPISVSALFAGGVIPGLLIAASLMIVAYIYSLKKHHPVSLEKFYMKDFIKSLLWTSPALAMPVIILGGILSGVFTPTEASAIAAAVGLFAGTVIYRTLTIRKIMDSFFNAAVISSVILLIVSVSNPFGQIVAFLQIPQQVVGSIAALTSNANVILFLIMVFLLVLGCVMETTAIVFLVAPIVTPLAWQFGLNPLHFGVVFVVNICIGLATPPFGLCLFVGSAIGKIPLEKVSRAILPFVGVEVAVLFIICYVPEVVLFLPRLMGLI